MTNNNAQLLLRWVIFNLAVTIWTLIIPGMAAYLNNTFYPETILDNLSNKSAKSQVEEDNAKKERIRASLNIVEDKIIQWAPEQGDHDDLSAMLMLKSELEKELREYRNRIRVLGFINSESTVFWWSTYFCIGALVFFFRPANYERQWSKKWIFIALLAYIAFEWTNWYRNTGSGQYGRKIYSYAHFDIGRSTFLLQELHILSLFILMIILLRYWWTKLDDITFQIREDTNVAVELAKHSLSLEQQFRLWQRNSIFLAVAFLPWTWFYWHNLVGVADRRYIFSAILLHLFWLFAWITMTSRLWNQSIVWRRERTLVLAKLASGNSKASPNDALISYIKELDPLPKIQVGLAAFASLVSFLSPFIDLIR